MTRTKALLTRPSPATGIDSMLVPLAPFLMESDVVDDTLVVDPTAWWDSDSHQLYVMTERDFSESPRPRLLFETQLPSDIATAYQIVDTDSVARCLRREPVLAGALSRLPARIHRLWNPSVPLSMRCRTDYDTGAEYLEVSIHSHDDPVLESARLAALRSERVREECESLRSGALVIRVRY